MPPTLDLLLQACPTVEVTPDAARYRPFAHGRYDVKPGLRPLGTDFRNGCADHQVFQLDGNYSHYHQLKQAARAEQLSKYYQTHEYTPAVATAIAQFIAHRLQQDQPQTFQLSTLGEQPTLHNHRTGETLTFDASWQLQGVSGQPSVAYASALDALASQIQEDLAVICQQGERHWVSAIHLCFPNHWAATEKIGQDFAAVHAPVAGMEKLNQRGHLLAHSMIKHPPSVRFAWGLSTDTRLNHHPLPPHGVSDDRWQGRQFMPQQPRLFVRVERQVIWGFPAINAALFTIRTYFWNCALIKHQHELRSPLLKALQSMSMDALVYKGLAHSKDAILAWLNQAN